MSAADVSVAYKITKRYSAVFTKAVSIKYYWYTTIQSKINSKLCQQRFGLGHGKRLIERIPIVPHNLYVSLKSKLVPESTYKIVKV